MVDKEIFQKVNETDLEALIDNIHAKKVIYTSHDKLSSQRTFKYMKF